MFPRIAGAILVLLAGIVLQLILGEYFGVWINFTFAALVAAVFFLDFPGLLVAALAAIALLNWQPAFSWEIVVLGGLPLLFFLFKDRFSWQAWLVNMLFVFAGIVFFYLAFGISLIFMAPPIFLLDLFGSIIFGFIVFSVLGKIRPAN